MIETCLERTTLAADLELGPRRYCVLPLGSSQIKSQLGDKEQVKSILLYGPSGSGKTMMAEAVANELGALMINMSPARLKGEFGGKNGATFAPAWISGGSRRRRGHGTDGQRAPPPP